jgi:hypothetical protein
MSFVLPGNNRQLRFTGEALAPAKDEPSAGPVALGKPRVRKPTTPPPQVPQATARPNRTPTHQSYTPASPSGRPGSYPPASIRNKEERRQDDYEDGQATMALDREGHDVMPGGFNNAPIPRHSSRPGTGPTGPAIPGFRPANPAAATVLVPNGQQDRPKGAPLALWIVAAVLAGILSYHVTPAVMGHFEEPPPAKAGG